MAAVTEAAAALAAPPAVLAPAGAPGAWAEACLGAASACTL